MSNRKHTLLTPAFALTGAAPAVVPLARTLTLTCLGKSTGRARGEGST